MNIGKNVEELSEKLGRDCTLVAVSKTKPVEDIKAAYDVGIRDFGENKVQELAEKAPQLPKDIRWHMIGHLQRNKVKQVVPHVHLIHSVDSLRLLTEINKQAIAADRIVGCLLQVHIAQEESKFGFTEEELFDLLETEDMGAFSNVRIEGIMGMATFTEDTEQVRREFQELKSIYEGVKSLSKTSNVDIKILSMGMSGDYQIAIEEGSNMVRVGSAIFGARVYA